MADLDDLIADLNDRLNDAANTQIPEANKIRYINHGIRATWPKLYRTVRDSSLEVVADQFEYEIPAAVGSNAKMQRIEIEDEDGGGRYRTIFDYMLVPGLTDPLLIFSAADLPREAGSKIRITAVKQLTELADGTDVYDGPTGTEELPVLYAMGIALARRLDDRIDHRRLSVTDGVNGVGVGHIMDASQFYFAQFELLLDRFAMPFPSEESM